MPHLFSLKPHVRDFVSQTMVYLLKKSNDIRSNLFFLFNPDSDILSLTVEKSDKIEEKSQKSKESAEKSHKSNENDQNSQDLSKKAQKSTKKAKIEGLASFLFHLVKGPLFGFTADSKSIFSVVFEVLDSILIESNFVEICAIFEIFAGKCAKRLRMREKKKAAKASDKSEMAFCKELCGSAKREGVEGGRACLAELVRLAMVRACVECWRECGAMEENIFCFLEIWWILVFE